jgi:hypothetical protein
MSIWAGDPHAVLVRCVVTDELFPCWVVGTRRIGRAVIASRELNGVVEVFRAFDADAANCAIFASFERVP